MHLPPGLAVVQRSEEEGRAYMDWHMRQAMSEPCFFSMQLLNAATPLVTQGKLAQEVVLRLRGQVVTHLNAAIRDPDRMLTIPVLLTVASIALHERLFGEARNALEIHGPAFSRMLALKGGIESLEVPRIGFALIKFTTDVLSSTNSGMSTGDLLKRWAPSGLRKQHPGYGSAAEQA
ncbi:Hypothetical predicted protein [Lecanosticta acicola]|uniref:Uncharacterized protein n=1 Tax=Lecanosticta acicola TaxID=111012 RepID=A0AAI9EA53_9PEZI|nr:Hypothetical predicted protein [Lecanosticta acicola]